MHKAVVVTVAVVVVTVALIWCGGRQRQPTTDIGGEGRAIWQSERQSEWEVPGIFERLKLLHELETIEFALAILEPSFTNCRFVGPQGLAGCPISNDSDMGLCLESIGPQIATKQHPETKTPRRRPTNTFLGYPIVHSPKSRFPTRTETNGIRPRGPCRTIV